jgi:succinyl-CoA synthetase alpha subunit
MSVLVGKKTRVLTQGITGSTGQLHTRLCREYGTQMVAGVTPGRGGTDFEGIPIFDTVAAAVRATGADASVIYVPPVARPTPSWRPPTPASHSSSASPRAYRSSTWCA